MFFKKIKNIKKKSVLTEENNFKLEVTGQDIAFNFLNEETGEISEKKFMRICREDRSGHKYWETVKPYEIIDGNLCVRTKSDIPTMIGWIVLSKTELENIICKM